MKLSDRKWKWDTKGGFWYAGRHPALEIRPKEVFAHALNLEAKIEGLAREKEKMSALSVAGVGAITIDHLLIWATGVKQVEKSNYSFKLTKREVDVADAILAAMESEEGA